MLTLLRMIEMAATMLTDAPESVSGRFGCLGRKTLSGEHRALLESGIGSMEKVTAEE
jgi:hypothetical protein